MFNNISYNVVVERFKIFADGHFLIKRFTHGQVDQTDLDKDQLFPWMHVAPVEVRAAAGARVFTFDVIFADIPRDKEDKTDYQKESISDCIRLAEDLLSEIQNGFTVFGDLVEVEGESTITPFIEEWTHTLSGCTLALTISVPNDYNACDIPADWAIGGGGGGTPPSPLPSLVLRVNNVNNVVQNVLDLVNGANVTIEDLGDGRVRVNSSGGGGGSVAWGAITGTLSSQVDLQNALNLKADISSLGAVAFSNDYEDLDNLPTIPAAQVNSDWNAVSGVAEILNKPTIPDASTFVPYTGATASVDLGVHSLTANNGTSNTEVNPEFFGVQNSAVTKFAVLNESGLTVTDIGASSDMNLNAGGLTFPDATSQYTAAPVNLDDLDDVNAPSPSNGQVLTYNTTSNEWEAATPASGGSVTSVGLTMPTAFNVAGSPVTTAGTLAVTGAGTTDQYIRGDGTLANFPATGGGGGQVFYFNGNISQGTIGGNAYYELGTAANTGPAANFTRATTGAIARFITDVGSPNHLIIPSGVWTIDIYLSETGGGSNHAQILAKLYSYDGANFTLIATSTMEEITNGSVPDLYTFTISVPNTVTLASDRIHIEFDIQNTNGKTVTLYTEDARIGEVHTTYAIGLSSLNGLTDSTQTFATGTSGTDFGISSAGSVHTFNLPTATASARGALSSADWSTFNGKQDSIGLTTVGSSLATLANPSAIRYVRINADNTVTAISAATLKTELGLLRGVQTSNLTSAITGTNVNITGCVLALDANSTYIGRLVVSSGFVSTTGFSLLFTFPAGSTMNVGQISSAAVSGQFMQWQGVTSGTALTNRLNQAANQIGLTTVEIFISTGANSGNLTPAFVTPSNGSTATVYGNATYIQLEKI
jgi:hypothetical protein